MDQLLDAVEASEKAMVDAQDELHDAFAESANAQPLLAPESEKQAAIAEALNHLAEVASGASAAVQVTGAEVEDVTVVPWHGGIKDAREAYLAHSEAWVDYLDAASKGAYDTSLSTAISATFDIAHKRFEDTLPVWARYDASGRVEDIWDD